MNSKCFAAIDPLELKEHQKAAYKRSGYAQAALYQQSYIQLIAPDVLMQLQKLADEIAVANGVDMEFRVHITNDSYIGTMSTGSGDIFIPMGYLHMVSNRDEIAFGLAREIAIQHRLIHLKDMEKNYAENQRNQLISYASGLVISSAINSTFNYYVTIPIRNKVMKKVLGPNKASYPYASQELQALANFQNQQQRKQVSDGVGTLLSLTLGGVPSTISSHVLNLVSHFIEVSEEESVNTKRQYKNELGLTYLGVAGFEIKAGEAAALKINEWWSQGEKKE